MEETEKESLDGSSIPVSSLRSHFEQMANAQPASNTATRGVSPKGHRIRQSRFKQTRGRDAEAADVTLRPPRADGGRQLSPSPTRITSQRPMSTAPPAVTVQPPQSPPKVKSLNLSLANTSAYLSTDAPFSASFNSSSQGHFRIPSRANTPLSDTKNLPSYPSSLPPSPPPPRRSGEVRRNSSFRSGPPPINRADKPKISSKPVGFSSSAESVNLAPISVLPIEKTSPFSTPPSSGGSLENEYPIAPPLPRNRPRPVSYTPSSRPFEPPPRHHSVSSRHRDHEANGLGRNMISPQFTGGRPETCIT
ncbi:hypothetical protein DID88_009620 [Monilinia fructigena]|uniref:Uncharacterized protein n=1 Tax=Monilinia fructigena TaxID=38457 RepID=A0A395IMP8_9HELO|nr:hypothetical protein DID88_009620 [Monilinia fructigena]